MFLVDVVFESSRPIDVYLRGHLHTGPIGSCPWLKHIGLLPGYAVSQQWLGPFTPYQIHEISPLRWRQNGRDSVSNHQPHDCLLNRLFRRRSKKTSKLRVTGLCARNSPGTGEFPAQMASYAENVSIWWRHHAWSTNMQSPGICFDIMTIFPSVGHECVFLL